MNKIDQVIPIDRLWCVEESYAAQVAAKLAGLDVAECRRLQDEYDARATEAATAQAAARKAKAEPEPKPYDMVGSTAVIPISGPMTKRLTSAQWMVGGTSTRRVRALLAAAAADDDVAGVLLHIDSPGGQVSGTAELADDVRELGKPVVAYIEDLGASAAYWVASQASAVYANRMARIGSIGVYMAVEDHSAAAAQKGVTVHLVKTGAYKGAGYPGTRITDAHLADFQAEVDAVFGDFKAAVALGRGLSDEQLAAVADGRTFRAADAAELGLIDGVCSLEQCLAGLAGGAESRPSVSDPSGPSRSAVSAAHDPGAARAASPKETTSMNPLQRLLAWISGNPEARASAGLSEAELAQMAASSAPVDPAVAEAAAAADERYRALEQRTASIELGLLNTLAEGFADHAIHELNVADPAERDALIGSFVMAAVADGDGKRARFEGGTLVEGTNMKVVRDGIAKRQPITVVRGLGGRTTVVPDARPGQADGSRMPNMGQLIGIAVAMSNGAQLTRRGQGGS